MHYNVIVLQMVGNMYLLYGGNFKVGVSKISLMFVDLYLTSL